MPQGKIKFVADEKPVVKSINNIKAAEQQLKRETKKTADTMQGELAKTGRAASKTSSAIDKIAKSADQIEKEWRKALRSIKDPSARREVDRLRGSMRGIPSDVELIKERFEELGRKVGLSSAQVKSLQQNAIKAHQAAASGARKSSAANVKNAASFKSIGSTAVSALGLGGGAAGLFGAASIASQTFSNRLEEINRSFEKMVELRRSAADVNRSVGEIQAEAAQNLASFSDEDKAELLSESPIRIARSTSTGQAGVKQLAMLSGIAASSGVQQTDVIKEILRVSAEANRLNPDQITGFGKAIAALLKSSGQQDDKGAVVRFASAIARGQEGSGVTTLSQFAKSAPSVAAAGALAAGANATAQQQAGAAFDAVALQAAISQKVSDDQGDISKTAAIQLIGKLNSFVNESIQSEQLIPSQIASKKEELQQAIAQARPTPLQQIDQRREIADIMKSTSDKDERRLRVQASEAAFEEGFADARRRVAELQQEVRSLESRLPASQGFSFGAVPNAPLARLKFLQRVGQIDEFQESVGQFGEEQTRQVINDIVTGGQTFNDVIVTRQGIGQELVRPQAINRAIAQQRDQFITDEMRIAVAARRGQSVAELTDIQSKGRAAAGTALRIVTDTVEKTADTPREIDRLRELDFLPGFAEKIGLGGTTIRDGGFGGNNLQQVIKSIRFLQNLEKERLNEVRATGSGTEIRQRTFEELSPSDRADVQRFRSSREAAVQLLGDGIISGEFSLEDRRTSASSIRREFDRTRSFAIADNRLTRSEVGILQEQVQIARLIDSQGKQAEIMAEMLDVLKSQYEVQADIADTNAETADNTRSQPVLTSGALEAASEARGL